MSTLSDVQALYGSVQDTWTKSRAHVLAHLVLAGVVFGICEVTVPAVAVGPIDLKQVSDNEWFKLAKDTGIVYALFVVPLVLFAAYAAILRAGGQLFVTMMLVIFPPSPLRSRYRLLTPSAVESLALTLDRDNFNFDDLYNKSSELAIKYQSQKKEQWNDFQGAIDKLTKNAQVYFGDFLLFLFFWIALFKIFSKSSWVQTNEGHFWPVVLLLSVLAWFSGFRVRRAVAAVPSLLVIYISMMVRSDPDMTTIFEISKEKRESIRQNLERLFQEQKEHAASRPSLREFIIHKAGRGRGTPRSKSVRQYHGWPFPSLYESGLRFSLDSERHTKYDEQWLVGYVAYLYYRLHRRLSHLAVAIWQLTRYILIGAP